MEIGTDSIASGLAPTPTPPVGISEVSRLGRDDFLRILIAQLRNQDPIAPVEDREFIAQMAQFSTLEQITNMSQAFTSLSARLGSGQALAMLGKTVELRDGASLIRGRVTAVSAASEGVTSQVRVEGQYYELGQVERIIEDDRLIKEEL